MRHRIAIAVTAAILMASPSFAQNEEAPANNVAEPAMPADNMVVDNNALATPAVPEATTAPPTDVTAPPAAPAEPARPSFPWGVLGLLGLIGLIGTRKRD